MDLSVSQVIDRPPNVVFDFVAINHLRNHPRWDPKMELEQLTEGPIGVGTRLRRRHTRVGAPIEGTMEITEFEPDHAMRTVIRDEISGGTLEVHARMVVEPIGDDRTELTFYLNIPAMHESMDPSMVEASLRRIKELIESET